MKTFNVAAATVLLGVSFALPAAARVPDTVSVLTTLNFTELGHANGITAANGKIFGTNTTYAGICSQNGCSVVYCLARRNGGSPFVYQSIYRFAPGATADARPTVERNGLVYDYAVAADSQTVFRLVPPSSGSSYALQPLYTFGGTDTLGDVTAPLVVQDGHVYGIAAGGMSLRCGVPGCGSVYRLDPRPDGGLPWKRTTLFAFAGGADGGNPTSLAWFWGPKARSSAPPRGYLAWPVRCSSLCRPVRERHGRRRTSGGPQAGATAPHRWQQGPVVP